MKPIRICLFILLFAFTTIFCTAKTDDHLITAVSVGTVKIGMSFNDFLKNYKQYRMIDYGSQVRVYDGKNVLFYVTTTDKRKTINDIMIFSDLYKTREGISVGTTIDNILKVFPDMVIEQDPEDFSEYFLPKIYQTSKSYFSIRLTSNDSEALGINYREVEDKFIATDFRKNGKVGYITIGAKPSQSPNQEAKLK